LLNLIKYFSQTTNRKKQKLITILHEIENEVNPYISKSEVESKNLLSGREEIAKKINDIQKRLDDIESDINTTKNFSMDKRTLPEELNESDANIAKYIQTLTIIESNIAEIKYQTKLLSKK